MKKNLLIALFILLTTQTIAQKLEYSVQANSGVSFFSGKGALKSSFLVNVSSLSDNYTYNVYGNQPAFSYGFSGDVKMISNHLTWGLQAGYDVLRSKVNLYYDDRYLANESRIAMSNPPPGGYTLLKDQFINLNPYVGYRINIKHVALDITPGMDIGFGLYGHETGQTKSNYNTFPNPNYNSTATSDQDRDVPKRDYRIRLDIKASYYNFGIVAGYSYGLTNYAKGMVNQIGEPTYNGPVYANAIRVGLTYRIY